MKEPRYGGLIDRSWLMTYIVIPIVLIGIIIGLVMFVSSILGKNMSEPCDYDSCSQSISNWKFNGSSCFDSSNPECKEFLLIWNGCQEHKKLLGVC
jgi:hypothetical protein